MRNRSPILVISSDNNPREWSDFDVIHCKLLTPKMLQFEEPCWQNFSAIIVSSIYAARAVSPPSGMPAFCVGAKVAEFMKSTYCFKSMKDLCGALSDRTFNLPLLYVRGMKVAADPQDVLPHLAIENLVVYKMIRSSSTEEARYKVRQFSSRGGKVLAFFSGENAAAFFDTFPSFPYHEYVAVCLGDHTAKKVRQVQWLNVETAAEPTTKALQARIIEGFYR